MLLAGKKLLVTGVLTPQSLAFGIAELAIQEGAEVVLTSFGRTLSLTQRSAKRLPGQPEVMELDVTQPQHYVELQEKLRAKWGRVDAALHAVAYAPENALGGNFLETPWESVQTAFRVSAFSFKELALCVAPLMTNGGALLSLDFDARVAWPIYDWMGVCKAGLEATTRYLAQYLGPKGIRVNTLAAGPLSTIAAKGIPGFGVLEARWGEQAPLGWNARGDHEKVARTAVALLSDYFPGTTGELVHVDGGYHAVGAPPVPKSEPAKSEEPA
ncbi:MAG: hypothetical protein RL653_1965 [Pseudomonadota bacterium]|jgi:enoyl-[acyl-carrier protein] reductase I